MKFTVIMNKEPKDKLDVFTKKLVQELPEEKPSIDFSKNVMQEIYALENATEPIVQKPLIPKTIWAVLIAVIVLASGYLFITVGTQDSILSGLELSKYTPSLSIEMPSMSVSNITVYGFIFLAVMISIQIGYIKNHYSRV